MEVKIKGTEEFVKACTNSTVLQKMIEKTLLQKIRGVHSIQY